MIQVTEREWEVGQHLRSGETNAQIGRKLGISEMTVKNHIMKMLDKTGALNRTNLVAILLTGSFLVENKGAHKPRPPSGREHGEAEYASWWKSLPDNLVLTVKQQSPGEEEYISWYFLGPASPIVIDSKPVGWIVSRPGGDVLHFSALDGYTVDAVAFQDQLFPEQS